MRRRRAARERASRYGPRRRCAGRQRRLACRSEAQAGLARGLRERLHAPVVEVAAPIEDAALGARLLGARGDQLAGLLRLLQRTQPAQVRLGPVDRCDGMAAVVVDELDPDAAVRAEHRQPGTLRGAAYLRAHAPA